MEPEPDAYRVLHVLPDAAQDVLTAAYRALARALHPDAVSGTSVAMARLNRAYELVRTPELRADYDRRRRWGDPIPVGPGSQPDRIRTADGADALDRLDFGRYAGWRIVDLARHDPDYLRWLSRHSAGVRFRERIRRLLPDIDHDRRGAIVA